MSQKQNCIASGCEKSEGCGGVASCAKWKEFQYLAAHAYPGSVHPRKLRICFADAACSQDVVMPLLLAYGGCLSAVVCAVFGGGAFQEPTEYDMVVTKENAARGNDRKARTEESYYCGRDDCGEQGSCSGPQDCPKWRGVQELIAHTSPSIVDAQELQITYHAREYDDRSMNLFSEHMEALVYSVQGIFEHYDEFEKVSVRLSG